MILFETWGGKKNHKIMQWQLFSSSSKLGNIGEKMEKL